jgi:hypothetical protein
MRAMSDDELQSRVREYAAEVLRPSDLRAALAEAEARNLSRRWGIMRSHVAAGVAFALGCFNTGCHKATFPQPWLWRASSVTTADLSWEEQSHLAPDMGATCAATVDNRDWDGSVFENDFSTKDRFVWIPQYSPSPIWSVVIPTGEVGADDWINLALTFKPTQEDPLVKGSFHAWGWLADQVTVRTDPAHDLVSVSWWAPPALGRDGRPNFGWSGECLARLPFRHTPP